MQIKKLLDIFFAPINRNREFFFFMYVLSVTASACTVVTSALQKLYDNVWAETFVLIYTVCAILALLPLKLRRILRGIFYAIAYPVAIVDVYCYVKFDAPLNPSIIMLMGETDTREASEFFTTYLSPDIILSNVGWILLIMLIQIIPHSLPQSLRRKGALMCKNIWETPKKLLAPLLWRGWGRLGGLLGVLSFILYIYCLILSWPNISSFFGIMQMHNLGDVEHRLTEKDRPEMFCSAYRLAFSIRANQLASRQIDQIYKTAEATRIDSCDYTSPNIVLIIGEAYNRSHSQLYGYNYPTTPRQLHLRDEGSLVPYTDVISPWNLTSYVFKHFMSTYVVGDEGDWCDYPLFGQIFRKAGYHVTFLTNEFLPQAKQAVYDFSGGFFINDPRLSEMQFDSRNKELHVFDEGLLNDYGMIEEERAHFGDTLQQGNLTIFHLIGQHQNYRIRCPRSKMHFRLEDYADRTDLKKEIWKKNLCWYDNATLYNDSIVNEIVNRFCDKDAIVIYMPDHGEEVHSRELPHFSGRMHSTKIVKRLAREEFNIPFWIYCSPRYRQSHPEIWQQVKACANRPYMTDALPHLLMYLAGIHCPYYREELNLLSPNYNAKRPRIIKHQVDYDEVMRPTPLTPSR